MNAQNHKQEQWTQTCNINSKKQWRYMLWSANCSSISEVWYKRRKVTWTIGIAALRRELLHVQRSSIFTVFMILSPLVSDEYRQTKKILIYR